MVNALEKRHEKRKHEEAWAGLPGQKWRQAWIREYEQNLQDLGFKKTGNRWSTTYLAIEFEKSWSKIEEMILEDSLSEEEVREEIILEEIILEDIVEDEYRKKPPLVNFAYNATFRPFEYEPITLEQLVMHHEWVIDRDKNMTQLGFIKKKGSFWPGEDWTAWKGLEDESVWIWPGASQEYSVPPDDVPCSGESYKFRTLKQIDEETRKYNPDMPVEESPLYLLGGPEETTLRFWAENFVDEYAEADAAILKKLKRRAEPRFFKPWNKSFLERRFKRWIWAEDASKQLPGLWGWTGDARKQPPGVWGWTGGAHKQLPGLWGWTEDTPKQLPELWIRTPNALEILTSWCQWNPPARTAYEIRGTLEGRSTVVIPDTGAGINTINTAFALSRGFVIQRDSKHRTRVKTLGKGTVFSDGIVQLRWAFKSNPNKYYDITFHAISSSPHDAMFGMPFLQETDTLNRNSHRITTRRILNSLHSITRNLCFQGTDDAVLPRVEGLLDDEHASALADSGCEVNIMSLEYARSRGYHIDTDPDSLERLKFADGSEKQTMGKVHASWQFPRSNDTHELTFCVLEDSHFDLVLGQDILFETKVFKHHAEYVTFPVAAGIAHSQAFSRFVNAVRRIPFWKKWGNRNHQSQSDPDRDEQERKAELTRRAKAEELIASMPEGPGKQIEIQVEEQRRQAWQGLQQQQRTAAISATPISNVGS